MLFTVAEDSLYSKQQKEILLFKKSHMYSELINTYGINSRQKLGYFLQRTILGFRIENINSIKSGPIPLVPDIVTQAFKNTCIQNANELNCLYTHKAISYLEQALSDRLVRAYEICMDLTLPLIYEDIETRIHDTKALRAFAPLDTES